MSLSAGVKPGITTFVRMPEGASSRDMNLVMPWSPAFAAPYETFVGNPSSTKPVETLTIRPHLFSRMSPTVALARRYGPTRFAVTEAVNRSGGAVSNNSPSAAHDAN